MWSSNEYIKKIKGGFYMVKVEKTPIPGLFVVDLYSFEDHRGSFMEKFSQKDLISEIKHVFGEDSDEYKAVKDFNVVQNNVSKNNKGVIRGLHAEPWNKYIYIVSGAAYGAWVDLRSGNSRVVYFHDLTEGNAVFVPEGVFKVLGAGAVDRGRAPGKAGHQTLRGDHFFPGYRGASHCHRRPF